jgi:hypothetical protein
MAQSELKRVEEALKTYAKLPKDVWIGKNGPADKVLWLIRRLENFERAYKGILHPDYPEKS